jgi:hypothetical protein
MEDLSMCMIDDAEPWDLSKSYQVKARKPHACVECGRAIAAGETYTLDKGLYEGYWDTNKTCAHCKVGQQWLASNCGGWMYECVREEMQEHAREYPAIAFGLLRVAVGIKRDWKRFDGAGLMAIPQIPRAIAETMKEVA